jgi:hypothetical protein
MDWYPTEAEPHHPDCPATNNPCACGCAQAPRPFISGLPLYEAVREQWERGGWWRVENVRPWAIRLQPGYNDAVLIYTGHLVSELYTSRRNREPDKILTPVDPDTAEQIRVESLKVAPALWEFKTVPGLKL